MIAVPAPLREGRFLDRRVLGTYPLLLLTPFAILALPIMTAGRHGANA